MKLKESLRGGRDKLTSPHATRLHGAVSWYQYAAGCAESDDTVAFIDLWISLNACYLKDKSTLKN